MLLKLSPIHQTLQYSFLSEQFEKQNQIRDLHTHGIMSNSYLIHLVSDVTPNQIFGSKPRTNYIKENQLKSNFVNDAFNDAIPQYVIKKQDEKNEYLLPEKTINQRFDEVVLSNAKIVVISAYMRTGSSLTGAILSKIKRAFYLFEPITEIASQFNQEWKKNKQKLFYLHGNQR